MGNVITLLHAEHLQSMDEVIGKMIRLCNPLSVTINDSRCLLLEKPALVKIVKELHYLESSLGSTDFQLTIIGGSCRRLGVVKFFAMKFVSLARYG